MRNSAASGQKSLLSNFKVIGLTSLIVIGLSVVACTKQPTAGKAPAPVKKISDPLAKANNYNMPNVDTANPKYCAEKPTIMQKLATPAAVNAFLAAHKRDIYVFGENRLNSIRRFDRLVAHWLKNPKMYLDRFAGKPQPGEFYVFQLGVYSPKTTLGPLKLKFADLRGPGKSVIPAKNLRCFNLGGVDFQGNDFTKNVTVAAAPQFSHCGLASPCQNLPAAYMLAS